MPESAGQELLCSMDPIKPEPASMETAGGTKPGVTWENWGVQNGENEQGLEVQCLAFFTLLLGQDIARG